MITPPGHEVSQGVRRPAGGLALPERAETSEVQNSLAWAVAGGASKYGSPKTAFRQPASHIFVLALIR